jgi:hypothetical protein
VAAMVPPIVAPARPRGIGNNRAGCGANQPAREGSAGSLASQAADKCACAATDQRATHNAILPPIRTTGERQCHCNHDKTLAYLRLIPIEANDTTHGTDPTIDKTIHDQTPTLTYRINRGAQRQKNTANWQTIERSLRVS